MEELSQIFIEVPSNSVSTNVKAIVEAYPRYGPQWGKMLHL